MRRVDNDALVKKRTTLYCSIKLPTPKFLCHSEGNPEYKEGTELVLNGLTWKSDRGGRRTYKLYIVDSFVLESFERLDSVSMYGEGHSLQCLLLGVHTDVSLHLNTQHRENFTEKTLQFCSIALVRFSKLSVL